MTDPYLAALTAAQDAAQHTAHVSGQLRDLVGRLQRPARWQTIVLTASEPTKRDEIEGPSASIGVINLSAVDVFLGLAGGSPTAAAQAPALPAGAAIVLPIAVEDLELGADPAGLAGGPAVVFLMRFAAVQPFFFAR